jgi:hypothetical protein
MTAPSMSLSARRSPHASGGAHLVAKNKENDAARSLQRDAGRDEGRETNGNAFRQAAECERCAQLATRFPFASICPRALLRAGGDGCVTQDNQASCLHDVK